MKIVSHNSYTRKFSIPRKLNLMVILVIVLTSSFIIFKINNNVENGNDSNNISQLPRLADGDTILFQGNEISLNITDYGNLYETEQQVDVTNQEAVNLTYYLDDVHNWEVSRVSTELTNVQDTREWVNNSDFLPVTTYRVNETHESTHDYASNKNKGSTLDTITQTGAIAMRVHFTELSYENGWDYFYMEDENDVIQYTHTGLYYLDFYSPWIRGGELNCYYESDNLYNYYGYQIDYYEFVNSSSNYNINSYSWSFNNISSTQTNYGSGQVGGVDAMFTSLNSDLFTLDPPDPLDPYDVTYFEDDFSEIYQNVTVPRGQVIDGYISFDYYAEYVMDSNENFIYLEINNKKVYSKGLGDVADAGKNAWHSTGSINMALWLNNSNIFDDIQNENIFNISVGIMSGATITYSGFEDRYQQVFWFDNVSLVLTTLANSSQSDINLRLNNYVLNQGSGWGDSFLNLTSNWDVNPLTLTVTTDSPSISFDLDTSIYGYHETKSLVGQSTLEGVSYEILENGAIQWEFSHNFYMPAQYSDFEFLVNKPRNWEILSVLDPTFIPVPYEGGNVGDDYIFLNKSSASYPGWWKFIATSPNFLQEENVETSRNNQWGILEFQTGNIGQIKAQINHSGEIPKDLDQTFANLTIYNPEGAIWFEDSATPLANGTVLFSNFNIAAQNSTGGIHNFTIFWGNGTSIGGLESNFIITHDTYITLLRPDDAKLDNSTGGSVGDIIPLRIYLRDSENDNPISNAILSFNWTSGSVYMVEIGLGIYDAIIDTSDLGVLGLYTIVVSSYKIGFENRTFNLEINLGEDTVLQRLGSDSSIVINQNSTITFYYYSEVDDEGITGAIITVNITNPMYYSVTETTPGTYSILINTVFLDSTGIYQLIFEFSTPGYEPQTHIYQFNIVNPPPPSRSNPFLELIIIISIAVIAILGALSIRTYVIHPRKRRKEADLLSRTQRFKDIQNIQAVVAIHRDSGIPLYTKSYSILEKQKKEIFSGFIQAIITVGEEMVGKRGKNGDLVELDEEDGSRTILELDFKYFYCLICDRQDLRIIFILTERASDRLKKQISDLSLGAMLELSEQIGNWDGAIHEFEAKFPPIVNKYVELFYKESFTINNADYIAKIRKEGDLNSLETRILNVIYSIAKSKREFQLQTIFELIHEKNEDIVIDGIETLIKKQLIIPSTK